MARRAYPVRLTINNRKISQVIIDPHYEGKHGASISDAIILRLVDQLNLKTFRPVDVDEDGFQYFVNDRLELDLKFYKLIWLLKKGEFFVGIVNAYRR